MSTLLIRPRAWWYNKVPLSVLTWLLLIDGSPLSGPALIALVGLVATVSCVANYGYALNELYDIEEDRRGGRVNAAGAAGPRRMWAIILLSGGGAIGLSMAGAGTAGLLLTAGVLLLPLTYSVPPVRTKDRGWLGVVCDAAAAHLYPAMLAILLVARQDLRIIAAPLALTFGLWSLMTGLRGILSHQLQAEEHDRAAGLATIVHHVGHARIAALVLWVILPIEVLAFAALVIQSDITPIVGLAASVFVFYEIVKFSLNAFPVIVFTRRGEDYIPFVDEGAYKVWGPLALVLDAGTRHVLYLLLLPLYVALFRPRVQHEWSQVRATGRLVWARMGRHRGGGQR